MIGLDTNIVLRLLLDDDSRQSEIARERVRQIRSEGQYCHLDVIVLVELVWVLESGVGKTKQEICYYLEEILANVDLNIAEKSSVQAAVTAYRERGLDFSDALIALTNRAHGCTATLTFDRKAARLPDFELVT